MSQDFDIDVTDGGFLVITMSPEAARLVADALETSDEDIVPQTDLAFDMVREIRKVLRG